MKNYTARSAAICAMAAMALTCGAGAPAVAQAAFGSAGPVNETELSATSGGADLTMLAVTDQSGTVSHNSVNGNSVTGTISFDDQAFQNLNGMAVINANTGNNVSINSALQVNIAIGAQP